MIIRFDHRLMLLLLLLLLNTRILGVLRVQAEQTEDTFSTLELLQRGEWQLVLTAAREQARNDSTNPEMVYLADLAADVLGDHAQPSLTTYDFPYSDRKSLTDLVDWARKLLDHDPKNVNLLIMNGMLHSPKGDGNIEKFTQYFKAAVDISSKNNFLFEALGSAYGAQGKYSAAITTLEKAIALRPTSGAHTNLGVALLKQRKDAIAVLHLKTAVKVDSRDAAAWFNLGSYYAERNRIGEAKTALEKATELAPKNLDARWNLGGTYFNTGQRLKAIEQLNEIIVIAPQSKMGRQAAQMLRQLGE